MKARAKQFIERIEYPESDGEPMAETDKHIQMIIDLRLTLREFFRTTEMVYVGSNLMFYYVEDDPTKSVAPDVFVAFGVGKHERRIYKLWEEGQAPQVVFEISSNKTKNEDLKWKKQLYAWLGVQEYFIFDPEFKLKPPLRAFRLHGKELVEEMVTGKRVRSEELGLELVNDGKTLRLFNPKTGSNLLTPEEEAAARRAEVKARQRAEKRAEHEAERAERETERAEREMERAERFAAKLRALGVDPDHL